MLDEGRAASAGDDVERAAECHREFHVAVEAMADHPYLEQAVGPLRHQTELVFSVQSSHREGTSWDEHQRIRDAIAAGDVEGARQATYAHMSAVVAALESTHT